MKNVIVCVDDLWIDVLVPSATNQRAIHDDPTTTRKQKTDRHLGTDHHHHQHWNQWLFLFVFDMKRAQVTLFGNKKLCTFVFVNVQLEQNKIFSFFYSCKVYNHT